MINLKRPLGLIPLFMVLLTLAILTTMLVTMVSSRVSLLQNGTQVVLKTAPVDPRDLLRGYYVRLNYEISRISVDKLAEPPSIREFDKGFKRRALIFVKLRKGGDGFWSPVSIHRTWPSAKPEIEPQTVVIRGRVRYQSCSGRLQDSKNCKISIRYGIEKFFTEKARAKKLEDFGRQLSPELEKINKQINELEKQYSASYRQSGSRKSPRSREIYRSLVKLRAKQSKLRKLNQKQMAKRFAILARIDPKSGDAAISGLQLDGKPVYVERLF